MTVEELIALLHAENPTAIVQVEGYGYGAGSARHVTTIEPDDDDWPVVLISMSDPH